MSTVRRIPVALVTGASSGIGVSIAKKLHANGYKVYGAARRVDRLQEASSDGSFIPVRMDLTSEPSVVEAVNHIIAESGRIDVLVNNAGYGSYGAVEDVPLEEAKRQFEVNVFGLAQVCQLVTPHMRAQRHGYILNVSSMGGEVWTPLGGWYHATKFAVEGLSNCMRLELEPFGVHVVVIQPGGIKSEWSQIAADQVKKTSSNGAYKAWAESVGKSLVGSEPSSSDPNVVAEAVLKAVKSKKPATRYAMGYGAKPLLTFRSWVTDRTFDWAIKKAVGVKDEDIVPGN